MIKRIETPEELSKLFPVIPSQYIQWLTEGIENPKLHIWVEFDPFVIDIIGYVVALDSVVPPLSNYFTILFDYGDSTESIQALGKEARSHSAKSVVMAVPKITKDMKKAGFKQVSVNIQMEL